MTNYHQLIDTLKEKKLTISTAESCTGGLISRLITDVPGSSEVFIGGVVSYSNEMKMKWLDPLNIILHIKLEVYHILLINMK